ncbi:MAG: oxidoreductase [Gemmatimonadetes bacterium]|nr:oxidoreductase [Gemmatimonadota bacterium]
MSRGEMRNAVLLGATGLVGGHCLELLLADPAYGRVTTLGRRASGRTHPRLDERVGEVDRLLDELAEFEGADLFCCLGTTIRAAGSQEAFRRVDHDIPVHAAQVASAGGARQFLLVSAAGADAGSRVFYNRVKGETEAEVAAFPFAGVALLRPSLLLGARRERRPAEAAAQKVAPLLAPLLVGPLRKYRAIHASVVAAAMVKLAKEGVRGTRVLESDQIERLGR